VPKRSLPFELISVGKKLEELTERKEHEKKGLWGEGLNVQGGKNEGVKHGREANAREGYESLWLQAEKPGVNVETTGEKAGIADTRHRQVSTDLTDNWKGRLEKTSDKKWGGGGG